MSDAAEDDGEVPQPEALRDHFNNDRYVIFIECGRRSTAAWVRERWDEHPFDVDAVVWNKGCAISCSRKAAERIQREAPDHWIEYVEGVAHAE